MARKGTDGRLHAKLSASESDRWMNCPGSVNKIAALPDSLKKGSSTYADEGTAAHSLAEMCLANGKDARFYLDQTVDGGARSYVVDEDMADAVQQYLDVIEELREEFPDADVFVEKKADLSSIHPEMFGTSDHTVVAIFDTLVITDYKHGAGVEVHPEDNSQLMYYAAGPAIEYDFNFDKVRLGIVQPRCSAGGINFHEITAAELEHWVYNVLKPAAYATEDPNAPLNPGGWCRFCAASSTCEALANQTMNQAQADFEDEPYDLPVIYQEKGISEIEFAEKLSRALQWLPMVSAWAKNVAVQAQMAAQAGMEIPGYKLVEKEANRSWKEKEEVIVKGLVKKGAKKEELYEIPKPKLKSPAQMEKIKVNGKKLGKPVINVFTQRLKTGVTLVKDYDSRPGIGASLVSEFEAYDETEE